MKISEIRQKVKINWVGITKVKFDAMTEGFDATYIDANAIITNKGYDNYRPIFQKFIEYAVDDSCLVGFLKEMYELLAWDKFIILPYRTLIDDLKSTKKNRYDVLYSMFSYYLDDTPIGVAKQTDEELFKKLMAEKFDDFLLGQPIELIRMPTRYNITAINMARKKPKSLLVNKMLEKTTILSIVDHFNIDLESLPTDIKLKFNSLDMLITEFRLGNAEVGYLSNHDDVKYSGRKRLCIAFDNMLYPLNSFGDVVSMIGGRSIFIEMGILTEEQVLQMPTEIDEFSLDISDYRMVMSDDPLPTFVVNDLFKKFVGLK